LDRLFPRTFPKLPIRLGVVETYKPESPFDGNAAADMEYARRSSEASRATLEHAFGGPTPWLSLKPDAPTAQGRAWRPFPGFPHSWQAVEWTAGAILYELVKLSGWGKRPLESQWASLQAEANRWIARARGKDAMDAPSSGDQGEFWNWLDEVASRPVPEGADRFRQNPARMVNGALESVASLTAEASLAHSAQHAARIPMETQAMLRSRHHPLRQSTHDGRVERQLMHQMLGQPLLIQDPIYADDHLLLLQLVWDPAMIWQFGDVGAYQFWIKEDDLRSCRFDRVKLTFESH
jgi:Domain of unknown function (DUF1963)